jgi:hypothetical protein
MARIILSQQTNRNLHQNKKSEKAVGNLKYSPPFWGQKMRENQVLRRAKRTDPRLGKKLGSCHVVRTWFSAASLVLLGISFIRFPTTASKTTGDNAGAVVGIPPGHACRSHAEAAPGVAVCCEATVLRGWAVGAISTYPWWRISSIY